MATLPALPPLSGQTSIKAAICYPITGTTNYTKALYTAALQPVKHATTPLAPLSGPMSGGQVIKLTTTQNSSGVPTTTWQPGSVVLVNGVAAGAVTFSADKSTLTAVTPVSSTDGAVDIVVRAPGFTDVLFDDAYTYTRAIKISPATATPSTATPITIKGAGFKSATYTDAGKAFTVTLDDGTTPVGCVDTQVVSDTEAVCMTPNTLTENVYKVVVHDNNTDFATASGKNVLSTGSVLVVAAF